MKEKPKLLSCDHVGRATYVHDGVDTCVKCDRPVGDGPAPIVDDSQAAPVLTVTELMRRWRCSRAAVLDAIHGKRLTPFVIGKKWYRVTLTEVQRFELAERAA